MILKDLLFAFTFSILFIKYIVPLWLLAGFISVDLLMNCLNKVNKIDKTSKFAWMQVWKNSPNALPPTANPSYKTSATLGRSNLFFTIRNTVTVPMNEVWPWSGSHLWNHWNDTVSQRPDIIWHQSVWQQRDHLFHFPDLEFSCIWNRIKTAAWMWEISFKYLKY